MSARVGTDNHFAHDQRSRRNGIALAAWAISFALSFNVGRWFFQNVGWAPVGPVAWVISLLPLIPGFLAFRAYLRFFRESDELVRKIVVEGLLFGVGLGMVLWGAIQLPEHVWLPKVSADKVVSVILLGTVIGTFRASRKYS